MPAAEPTTALVVAGVVEPAPPEIAVADFGGSAINPPIVIGAQPWAARAAKPEAAVGVQSDPPRGELDEPAPETGPALPIKSAG